jgi:hypothetical protein
LHFFSEWEAVLMQFLKLPSVGSESVWKTDFVDAERAEYHRQKMESKRLTTTKELRRRESIAYHCSAIKIDNIVYIAFDFLLIYENSKKLSLSLND